jgi:hypothetical protein
MSQSSSAARGAAHLGQVSPSNSQNHAKPRNQHAYATNKPKRVEVQGDVTRAMNVAHTHIYDSRKTECRFPRQLYWPIILRLQQTREVLGVCVSAIEHASR